MHSRDTERLIHVLKELQGIGNTVIVVEHDEEIMRVADYLVDVGPNAGKLGGEIVFEGNVSSLDEKLSDKQSIKQLLEQYPQSHTIQY